MYLPALFFAFLAPALFGIANVLDNFLVGRLFKNIPALIFYSELLNLFFIAIVWILSPPDLSSWAMLPFFIATGACDVLYLYPYFKALQTDDTAVVSSLFALGKIFVPILAFFVVGETLTFSQYAGFMLVILSSVFLTLHLKKKQWRIRPAFFYMAIASLLISLEVVLYKYLFTNVSWSTGFIDSTLAAFLLSMLMLFIPPLRQNIIAGYTTFRRRFPLIAFQEFLTISATASFTYATSLLPATVISGVGESQSFMVLLYAVFFAPFFPKVFKEKIDGRSVRKKIVLFALTIIGVLLILN